MQKCLIFLTLLFSVATWAMPSWNPYLMTHERFVHLSPEEQNKIIVKTMEMIVELDAQTQKSVVNNDRSQEHLEKYFVLIKKLQNFVMSEAYAQETDPGFLKLAKDFSTLLNKLGKDGCIYAGYVSRLVLGRCTNPSLLVSKGKNDEITRLIKASYLNKTGQKDIKCGGEKKISCNPVVFGYKNNGSKVPFCIATSPSESHNASYECMNKALSDAPEKGADTKEERLNYIKSALKDPKSAPAFNDAHKFIFRTCVCGDTDLNATYKGYMKPHRTCFGMLNTLRAIESTECSALSTDTFKASFAEEWTNYFGSSKFSTQDAKKAVPFDSSYGDLMSKQDMKVMCGIGGPAVGGGLDDSKDEIVCDAPCVYETDKENKKTLVCTVKKVTITPKGKSSWDLIFKPFKYTPKENEDKIEVTSVDGQVTYSCPIVKPEEEANKCSITSVVSADKTTATLTVSFTDGKEHEFTWDGDGKTDKEDSKIFIANYTKEKKTVSVSINSETKPEAGKTDPDCSTEVGGDDAGDAKTYAIAAKAGAFSASEPKIKVKAVVSVTGGDEALPETHKIVWVRQGYKGPVIPAAKVEKESEFKMKDGDASADKPEVEKAASAEKPAPTKEEAPGAKESEIEEPRNKEEYKSCAQLLDEKNDVVAESCAPIPPLGAGPVNNGPAPKPVFMTPAFNTRTMGIQ